MSDYSLKLLFPNKVWPHKVNHMEQLERARHQFPGVELDIVFEKTSRNFDVNHPPDKSSGLSLDSYLDAQHTTSELNYWLDFKNLDYDNDSLSLAVLDSLVTLHHIAKSRVIVECGNPQYLKGFREKGFKTSYYLPPNLQEATKSRLDSLTGIISKDMAAYTPTYISFEYKDYRLLKEKFPDAKKITWFDVYGSMNKMTARLLLFDLLMDEQVEVLLIPFD